MEGGSRAAFPFSGNRDFPVVFGRIFAPPGSGRPATTNAASLSAAGCNRGTMLRPVGASLRMRLLISLRTSEVSLAHRQGARQLLVESQEQRPRVVM